MMKTDDVKMIAGDVVKHLLDSQTDLDFSEPLNEEEEELVNEGAKLLWQAANDKDLAGVKSFTVRRNEEGNVILVANR